MLNEKMLAFLRKHHSAIIVTVRKNGTPHTARVTAGLVDGKVWISGTQTRVRTRHMRDNPNVALSVLADDGTGQWLGIEGRAILHEGPDVPDRALALRRVSGREPDDVEAFKREMVEQQRLICEIDPVRTYGRYE